MGTHKKEKSRREREGKPNDGMGNVRVKGENFYRSGKKVKNLKRLTDGAPQRNARGDVTQAASYQSRETKPARVEPNRKWFGNTRVISQDALASFRDAVNAQKANPTTYLLKRNKLPMSLIENEKKVDGLKVHGAKIAVESQPFNQTFGPKAQRKRPKLDFSSMEDLASRTGELHDNYLERLAEKKLLSGNFNAEEDENEDGAFSTARESIFSKGTSKRIWNELYKVIDSSDVILHVLDARDPIGTQCKSVEKYLHTEAPHKHLVYILNKVDLVPSKVAAGWVRELSKSCPTLAFHASINNSFGKGSLIALLRQFSSLHSDRKQISVGLIGYPNVGKSSIVNTLRNKPVATVAPIAGETKVWQYVTLMKRIYLIDCPGIVPPNQADTDEELLLRGSVRVENVEYPGQYIDAVLRRVQPKHLQRTYEIKSSEYKDAVSFLELLCRKSGRLLKGGEADIDAAAKQVLNDWIRGKLPWFVPPPVKESDGETTQGIDGRQGKLGEMGKKRKRGAESEAAESVAATTVANTVSDADEEGQDDEFSGFSDEAGLELSDEDEDEEDVEHDTASGEKESASQTGEDADDDDEAVEEDMAAISAALSKAKKRQRTE